MQSRITNLAFCRSSDVINNPVEFHEAILIGCQVTEGTPLADYDAKFILFTSYVDMSGMQVLLFSASQGHSSKNT